jgi:hypothetical protein
MRYRLFRRSRQVVKATTAEPKLEEALPLETEPPSTKLRKSRIPLALQAVFLASNRGHDVHEPPPAQTANRSFGRFWKRRGAMTGPKPTATAPSSPSRTAHSESTDTTESTLEETPVGTYVNYADKHPSKQKTTSVHKRELFPCPTKKVVKVSE